MPARLERRPIVLGAINELRLQRRENLAVRQRCWVGPQRPDQADEHVRRRYPDLQTLQVTRLTDSAQVVVEAACAGVIDSQAHEPPLLERLENGTTRLAVDRTTHVFRGVEDIRERHGLCRGKRI